MRDYSKPITDIKKDYLSRLTGKMTNHHDLFRTNKHTAV